MLGSGGRGMALVLLPTIAAAPTPWNPMPTRRLALIAAIVAAGRLLSRAGLLAAPYRMNIQQGNFLETRDVDQIQVGMTQSQVRFLIGTPMVADPFNAKRWDYVFFFKVGRTREEITSRLTIWFEDDRVVRIDRPDELEDTSPRTSDFDA
jgi:outer membrane protein assembly factor BamE